MSTNERVGTLIQRARTRMGLTQMELADRLGVHAISVANWETGKHYPLRHAGAVEQVLGISLDEVCEPEGDAA